jgi:hypothetical protein
MGMDTATFDAVFFSFLITSVIGCILGFTKLIYKSKCKSCSCCGVKIERDVEGEEKIDALEIERSSALGNNNLGEESKK